MEEFAIDHEYGGEGLAGPSLRRQRKLFSPAEASRALVLVNRIVVDILDEYARLNDLQETIEAAQHAGKYDRGRSARDELVDSVECIRTLVAELDGVGVILRDWTLGVVDFPCLIDGREVALCWRVGDEAVEYWHEPTGQCGNRQPMDRLPGYDLAVATARL